MTEPVWDGAWVSENLGVSLEGDGLTDLVGLALRRNPRRAHLLVSHVLGKHIPVDPVRVLAAATALGRRVGRRAAGPYVVLGYAETATGLGHGVAAALGSDTFLHSTRRPVPEVAAWGDFEEEHSHATEHLLLPEHPETLRGATLVLVDDELSTGRTIANSVRALPLEGNCLAAALVDLRAPDAGPMLPAVSLARGSVHLPADLPQRAADLIERFASGPAPANSAGRVIRLARVWPSGVREGGRHGFGRADEAAARVAALLVAEQILAEPLGERVLVLGCEELMHAPTLIAAALAGSGKTVHTSSTTRSPVAAVDEPGYAVRTALQFPAHDDPADGPGPRYAYNVAPARGAPPYTDTVLVVDSVADTTALWGTGGLVEALSGACERVYVAVLPSYRPPR